MANVRDGTELPLAPPASEVEVAPAASSRPARPRWRTTLVAFTAVVGPGIIAASAGNDAGGIATFSTIGAIFAYSLVWIFALITISLAMVQEMCARMGAATGKGLADYIRENFGIRRTALV